MHFEFLLVYKEISFGEIKLLIKETLMEALVNTNNIFEEDYTEQLITPIYKRDCKNDTTDPTLLIQRTICGFRVELPDEITEPYIVISEFYSELKNTVVIEHVIKFEDPLVLEVNLQYSRELFYLEMKLRQVLSIIYLSCSDSYYDLLSEEVVAPIKPPHSEKMKSLAENEFFYFTFSQYISLNKRKLPKTVDGIVSLIQSSDGFEMFKREFEREPIEDEYDRDFLANIRNKLESIEKLRNCVAHNRLIPTDVIQDYLIAKPLLDQTLEDFISRHGISLE